MGKLRAGAAASNITPPLGVSLNGGMTDRKATHIHDELHARCLVLDDGRTRLAFVVCDSCMIDRELMDAAKAQLAQQGVIDADRILISATHTHSAPTSVGVFQSDPEPEYREFLQRRIVDGVIRAVNNLEPAKLAWAVGQEPGQVFNRRWYMKPGTIPTDPFGKNTDRVKMNPPRASENLLEPAGTTDPDVSVISVTSPEGRPIGLLGNYSLHYVGGTGAGHVSADYFGLFAQRMQALLNADRLDPPFVGIMSNGTSGDINNVNFRQVADRTAPYVRMQRVAHDVAYAAYQALLKAEYHDDITLDSRQELLTLGRRLPQPDEVARAKYILSQAPQGKQLRGLEQIYARETVLMADWPPTIEIVLQAHRIGEAAICAIPCETFVEIGLSLKEKSPFKPTFTIELANGYAGYLPTEEQHKLGGYETWRARSSFLEEPAAGKIQAVLEKLLNDLHHARA